MPHQPFPSPPCQESNSCHNSPTPRGHAQQKLHRQGQNSVTYPPPSTSPHSHPLSDLLHSTHDMYTSQPKFVGILTFVPCGKNTQHPPSISHLSHTHARYTHTHPQEYAKNLGPDTVPSTLTTVKKVGFLLSRPPTPTPQIYPPVPQHPPYNATPPHVPTAVTECQLTKHSIHPPHPLSSPHTPGKNGHLPQGLAT